MDSEIGCSSGIIVKCVDCSCADIGKPLNLEIKSWLSKTLLRLLPRSLCKPSVACLPLKCNKPSSPSVKKPWRLKSSCRMARRRWMCWTLICSTLLQCLGKNRASVSVSLILSLCSCAISTKRARLTRVSRMTRRRKSGSVKSTGLIQRSIL